MDPIMLAPFAGASFDAEQASHPQQASRLHQAYDLARELLKATGSLDDAVSRKLTSALIRYARTDERREPEEIARLAVMHVRIASAPLKI